MLGDEVCKSFVRELYVRWQPHEGNPGHHLLEGAEKLTELVRAREDDLVLFAQKGMKLEEKKVKMAKFMCSSQLHLVVMCVRVW